MSNKLDFPSEFLLKNWDIIYTSTYLNPAEINEDDLWCKSGSSNLSGWNISVNNCCKIPTRRTISWELDLDIKEL